MALFSKLFGGGSSPPEPEPEIYQDFRIYIEPINDGSSYRLAARIEKTIDGELKTHQLVRADTFQSAEQAEKPSLAKAKQVIDEQGDGIFW